MKLYYKPGTCSLAVHIALTEIGTKFALDQVDTDAQKTETGADYAKISPNGYVPALALDGGDVLTEAPAILQHIEDQNPAARVAPANGTMERTRLQQHLNFVASELHKSFGPFFSGRTLGDGERKAAEAKLQRRMDHLNTLLGDKRDYLMGDDFTVADAYAFVVANWAGFIGLGYERWPHIAAYLKRVSARPAVQKSMQREGLLN